MFNWIAKIAVQKAASRGLKTFLGSNAGILGALHQIGVDVTINQSLLASSLAGLAVGAYEFFRNYAKSKGKNLP